MLREREEPYIAGKRDQMSLKSSKLSLFLKKVTLSIAARSESPICQDNVSGVDKDFQTWRICCLATCRCEGPTWAWPLNLSGPKTHSAVESGLRTSVGSLRPCAHCLRPSRFLPRYLRLIQCKQRQKGVQGKKQREREQPEEKGEKKNTNCAYD